MSFKSTLFFIPFLISNVISIQLTPIHSLDDITGHQTASKRSADFTGDLDLHHAETFFWGAPGKHKNIRDERDQY